MTKKGKKEGMQNKKMKEGMEWKGREERKAGKERKERKEGREEGKEGRKERKDSAAQRLRRRGPADQHGFVLVAVFATVLDLSDEPLARRVEQIALVGGVPLEVLELGKQVPEPIAHMDNDLLRRPVLEDRRQE